MRKLSVLLFSLLIGCGGGGGGGDGSSAVTAPVASPDNLHGTYALTGFDVKYSDGTFIDETNQIVKSFSGTMKISDTNYISQSVTLNGSSDSVSGYVDILWKDKTYTSAGFYVVGTNILICTIDITTDGEYLTTYSSGNTVSGTTITYQEWDYWQKVSNSFALKSETPVQEQDAKANSMVWVADLLH